MPLLIVGIAIAVFVTSLVSAVFGMLGGMMLMAIYLAILPFEWAMALHGATQVTSNGFRAWLLCGAIAWRPVLRYGAGAAGVFVLLTWWTVQIPAAYAYLLLGSVPWLALLLRRIGELDFSRPRHAASCGALVTGLHLTAGVSGPVLDVFFLRGPLLRDQVIATKAVTQTLGHLGKVWIFVPIVLSAPEAAPLPVLVWPVVLGTAVLGTRVGRGLGQRLGERGFRRITGRLVLILGTLCVLRGVALLVSSAQGGPVGDG